MTRRPLLLPAAALLLAGLAVLPACNKNKPDAGGGGDGPTPPDTVNTDYVLFAHLNAKHILDSDIFKAFKQEFAKAGGMAEWDRIEQEVAQQIGGVKPTEIDSVTVCVTEVPPREEPKVVLIMAASKPIQKSSVAGIGKAMPDPRGFYNIGRALAHFPDDKTLVIVHPSLSQKYLDGYAKNRTGWPMTAELTKAASGHTLYAVANVSKVPSDMFGKAEAEEFGALLKARTITLTADLKGKELSVAARATFPDAASAGKAKETVNKFIGMAMGEIDKVMKDKGTADLGAMMAAVREAHRALKEAKVEVSGSDLTIAGSYKADFDIAAAVADAVKKVREAAARMTSANNLKQIGLGLHAYSDAYNGALPVHAVGAKGQPLKNATDKPLLSWRVALLPYIDQQALYNEFKHDQPWDSEHNKKLIEKMPKVYAAPNSPGKPGYTHYQMVVGPIALQPVGMKFPASFRDGTSNTIAVVEAAEPVIWTKPDDVMLPGKELPKDLKKKFGGLFPGGFNVVMWDGSVRFVSDAVSEKTLAAALTPAGGEVLGDDW